MTISERLERMEQLLVLQTKNVLDVHDVALLLKVTEDRVRHLMVERSIPYYKRGGKCLFSKQEIEKWQLSERIPTKYEAESLAATYIATNKHKR